MFPSVPILFNIARSFSSTCSFVYTSEELALLLIDATKALTTLPFISLSNAFAISFNVSKADGASSTNLAILYETNVGTATEGDTLTVAEAAAYNATLTGAIAAGDTKVAATGLYKYVDDHVQAATPEGFAQLIDDVDTLETTVSGLEDRIEALEDFDPWGNYVAPVQNSGGD